MIMAVPQAAIWKTNYIRNIFSYEIVGFVRELFSSFTLSYATTQLLQLLSRLPSNSQIFLFQQWTKAVKKFYDLGAVSEIFKPETDEAKQASEMILKKVKLAKNRWNLILKICSFSTTFSQSNSNKGENEPTRDNFDKVKTGIEKWKINMI